VAQWATFAGLTVLSLSLFLALARLSQSAVDDRSDEPLVSDEQPDSIEPHRRDRSWDRPRDERHDPADDGTIRPAGTAADAGANRDPAFGHTGSTDNDQNRSPDERPTEPRSIDSLSTGAVLLNVAFSQGLFGGLVVLGAWYTEIPLTALGIGPIRIGTLAVGLGLGVCLYAGNELIAAGASLLGYTPPEVLRETLAPESIGEWALLLGAILPAVAFVEELLFRAAFVGAISAGFAVSPWPLVVVSSIAFGFGHGAQGSFGMVVTGALGFALAATFVLTGSLLVVVIAHYLVNAVEFAVHEGLGIEFGPAR
jgi:uncharacterized protein